MKTKPPFQDPRLKRQTHYSLSLPNSWDIPVRVCANEQIQLEEDAVDELLKVVSTQETLERLLQNAPGFLDTDVDPRMLELSISPDFHKGKGIPIGTIIATRGFVLPQAIGNDVNCGMRLMTTSYNRNQVEGKLDAIEKKLRYLFFQGGRDLPMTPAQRQALVRYGIPGLIDTFQDTKGKGIWRFFNTDEETANLTRIHGGGSYPTEDIFALTDYISEDRKLSHDSITGTLGGGNHFAEIQFVKKILDGPTAYDWGLAEGQIVVMIHTGSLGLGQITGRYFKDLMRDVYPQGLPHPENGIYLLPTTGKYEDHFRGFWTSMSNAANFAFGNRLFLALMVRSGLESELGVTEMKVVYDAPHNLIWEDVERNVFIHRKGATPANGFDRMDHTPHAYYGEPVIVPGSMGAPSYLLRGTGNQDFLSSACHGAGRQLSRGSAMHVADKELDEFLASFRVVTPMDFKNHEMRKRPDILEKIRAEIKQEAPFAYKEITPVIETLREADVAHPVAEFYPLMTVKG
ncbi:RtcB family protein [Thermodesulfobacteriota bacterium]